MPKKDVQREAELAGLFDPPKEIHFETDGHVRHIEMQCPDCGYWGSTEMTVFLADYSDDDCRADFLAGHRAFDCKSWKNRIPRAYDRLVAKFCRKVLHIQKTPWGWKHISWRPNIKPRDEA